MTASTTGPGGREGAGSAGGADATTAASAATARSAATASATSATGSRLPPARPPRHDRPGATGWAATTGRAPGARRHDRRGSTSAPVPRRLGRRRLGRGQLHRRHPPRPSLLRADPHATRTTNCRWRCRTNTLARLGPGWAAGGAPRRRSAALPTGVDSTATPASHRPVDHRDGPQHRQRRPAQIHDGVGEVEHRPAAAGAPAQAGVPPAQRCEARRARSSSPSNRFGAPGGPRS